jgi:uncharacterized membrane protein YgcG
MDIGNFRVGRYFKGFSGGFSRIARYLSGNLHAKAKSDQSHALSDATDIGASPSFFAYAIEPTARRSLRRLRINDNVTASEVGLLAIKWRDQTCAITSQQQLLQGLSCKIFF